MNVVKIYPHRGQLVGTRKVLYIACEALPSDITETYSMNNSKRIGKGEKSVDCYGARSGIHLGSYDSIQHASEKTGIDASNISKACRGEIPTAGDMKWSYTKLTTRDN